MRVIYSTRPYLGHFHPFVPLGRELRKRGHFVATASGPQLIPAVETAGFQWLPAGLHPSDAAEQLQTDDVDYGIDIVRAKVNDLLEAIMTWYRPDLVIREPTDLAAAIATEVSGTPCVTLGVSHFIPAQSWQFLAADALRDLREEYRLAPDPDLGFLYRGLYLDIVPPSWERFEGPSPAGLWSVGYRAWDGEADIELPPDLAGLDPAGTNVLITLGTVYNDHPELLDLLVEAFEGDDDITLICTTGAGRPAPAATSPNLHVVDYLPHSAVLPSCKALLCHGGFNTVMGALSLGVPVVCVPLGADQYYNAHLCEERGVGIALARDNLTPEAVRDAVGRVLEDPSYLTAATRMRNEIRSLPTFQAVSVVLEQMLSLRGDRRGAW
jgi:UDP:flavonoid glycosyltransferase YjiC (YdhE family)